jgi:hypothetical protein
MLLFVTGNYQATSDCGAHISTDWEVAEDASFNTLLLQDHNDAINLTSYFYSGTVPTDPVTGEFIIYIRARFRSNSCLSDWFPVKQYTYIPPSVPVIRPPTLTVEGFPNSTPTNPNISATPFEMMYGADNHISTDWVVVDQSTGNAAWESLEDAINLNGVILPLNTLTEGTQYEFRVRYHGQITSSDWSTVISLVEQVFIDTPTLTVVESPGSGNPNGDPLQFTIFGSSFNVSQGTDTHQSTDWQIYNSDGTTLLWESLNDTVNLESVGLNVSAVLAAGIQYGDTVIIKARYNGIKASSIWGNLNYTFSSVMISAPTITPVLSTDYPASNLLEKDGGFYTGTAFSVINGGSEHASSTWVIKEQSTGNIVYSSVRDTVNLTSIMIPDNVLEYGQIYDIELTYHGRNIGDNDDILGIIDSGLGQLSRQVEPDPESASGFVATPYNVSYPHSVIPGSTNDLDPQGGIFEYSGYVSTAINNELESIYINVSKLNGSSWDSIYGTVISVADLGSNFDNDQIFFTIEDNVFEYGNISYRIMVRYVGERFSSNWSQFTISTPVSPSITAPALSASTATPYRINPPYLELVGKSTVTSNSDNDISIFNIVMSKFEVTYFAPVFSRSGPLGGNEWLGETDSVFTITNVGTGEVILKDIEKVSIIYHDTNNSPIFIPVYKTIDMPELEPGVQYRVSIVYENGTGYLLNKSIILRSDTGYLDLKIVEENKWYLYDEIPFTQKLDKAVYIPSEDGLVVMNTGTSGSTTLKLFYNYIDRTLTVTGLGSPPSGFSVVNKFNSIFQYALDINGTIDESCVVGCFSALESGTGDETAFLCGMKAKSNGWVGFGTTQVPLTPPLPDNEYIDASYYHEAKALKLSNNTIGVFQSFDLSASGLPEIITFAVYNTDQDSWSSNFKVFNQTNYDFNNTEQWALFNTFHYADLFIIDGREVICLFVNTRHQLEPTIRIESPAIYVFDSGSLAFLGAILLDFSHLSNYHIVKTKDDSFKIISGYDSFTTVLPLYAEITIENLPGDSYDFGGNSGVYEFGRYSINFGPNIPVEDSYGNTFIRAAAKLPNDRFIAFESSIFTSSNTNLANAYIIEENA